MKNYTDIVGISTIQELLPILNDTLRNLIITGDDLEDGSVSSQKISTDAIGSQHIEVAAVEGDHINNGAVSENHLDDDLQAGFSVALGKNQVYFDTEEPAGGTYNNGDTWFKLSCETSPTVIGIYNYDEGTNSWILRQLNTESFTAGCITTELLAAGAITADMINAIIIAGNKIYFGDPKSAHGELYANGGVTYFDQYDAATPPVKRASWTYNGMGFIDSSGNVTWIATTTEDKTITVGNGKEFATPQEVHDSLPKFINHNIVIDCYSGTYDALSFIGYDGSGSIVVQQHPGETVFIDSVYLKRCSCIIHLQDFTVTATNKSGIFYTDCRCVDVLGVTISSLSVYDGIFAMTSGGAIWNCTVSGRTRDICITGQSSIWMMANTLTGTGIGISNYDSTIFYEGNTNTCATPYNNAAGIFVPDAGMRASGNGGLFVTASAPGVTGDFLWWDATGNAGDSGKSASSFAPASGISESAIAAGSETGNGTKLVTGTAGTSGNFASWDANGNIVDSGVITAHGGWVRILTLGFSNGWTDYDTTGDEAYYSKDQNGIVRLTGLVKSGSIGLSYKACTLPQYYRPLRTMHFGVGCYGGTGDVRVDTDGSVRVYVGSATWTSFSGITFRAEN